jgi:hypothetical protein
MQPVIDVQGAQLERRTRQLRERREERGGVHPAAEGDACLDAGEAGQEPPELGAERARAERPLAVAPGARHGRQAAVSANTPNAAILAERAARS